MYRPILRKKRAKKGGKKRAKRGGKKKAEMGELENVTELSIPLRTEVENNQRDSLTIPVEQEVMVGIPLVKREPISSSNPDQDVMLKIGMVTSLKNLQNEENNLLSRRIATRSFTKANFGPGKEMNAQEDFLYSLCGSAKRKKENVKNLLTLSSFDFSDDTRLEDEICIKEEDLSCTPIELVPEDEISDCNYLINEAEVIQNLQGQNIEDGIFIVDDFTDNLDVNPSSEIAGDVLSSNNTYKKTKRPMRKHYCLYCDKLCKSFGRHLIRNHKQEEPVKEYLAIVDKDLKLRKRKRLLVFDKLRSRFDYIYNQSVIKNSKEPLEISKLLPCKRPAISNQYSAATDYITCKICYRLYSKKSFSIHARKCFEESNEGLDSKFRRLEKNTTRNVDDAAFGNEEVGCNLEEIASDIFTDHRKDIDMGEDGSEDEEIIKEMGFSSEIFEGMKRVKTNETKTLSVDEKLPFGTNCDITKSTSVDDQLTDVDNISEFSDDGSNVSMDVRNEYSGDVLASNNTYKRTKRPMRKHYCLYCDKLCKSFRRHLINNHKQEEPVKEFLAIVDKDLKLRRRKRALVFDKLRSRFDYIYNQSVIKNSKEPLEISKLLPNRRPPLSHQYSAAANYITCKICYGLYSKKSFSIHARKCFEESNEGLDSKFRRLEKNTTRNVDDAAFGNEEVGCNLEEITSDIFTDHRKDIDMGEDGSEDEEIIKEMGFSSEIFEGMKRVKTNETKTLSIVGKLPFDIEQSILKETNSSANRMNNTKTNKDDSEAVLSTNCDIIKSASVDDQLTDVDNISEFSDDSSNVSMDVRNEHSEKGTSTSLKTKRMFCVYCKKHITNFRRHMTDNHKQEEAVVHYLSIFDIDIEERKKRRQLIFDELRRKGNLLYRETVLQRSAVPSKDDKTPPEKYQSTSNTATKEYVMCKICRGNFPKESIDFHIFSCSKITYETIDEEDFIKDLEKTHFKKEILKGKSFIKTLGLEIIPYSDKASAQLKEIFFPSMKKDKIWYTSIQDPLVVSIVSDFTSKNFQSALKCKYIVSKKLRDAGNLILKLREKDPDIQHLKDCFNPRKLKVLISTIKEMCGLNEQTGEVDIEGMEYRLLWIIRKSAIKLIDDVTSNTSLNNYHKDMVKTSIREFIKKFKCRWQWIMLSKIEHSEKKELKKMYSMKPAEPNHEERSKLPVLPTDELNPSSQIPPTNLDNPSSPPKDFDKSFQNSSECLSNPSKVPAKNVYNPPEIPSTDLNNPSFELLVEDLEKTLFEIPTKDLEKTLSKTPTKDLEMPSSEVPPKDPSSEIQTNDLETPSSEIQNKDLETPSSEIHTKDLETPLSEIQTKGLETPSSEFQTKDLETPSSEISPKELENPSECAKEFESPTDLGKFSKIPTNNLNNSLVITSRENISSRISSKDASFYQDSPSNSDDNLSPEMPPKKKRRRWTDEEKSVVLEHFKEHIKSRTNPGYIKCRELIMKEPVLKGRTCAQLNILIDNYNRGKITLPGRYLHLQQQQNF